VRSSTSDVIQPTFNPVSRSRSSRRLMSMTSLTRFGSYETSRQPPIWLSFPERIQLKIAVLTGTVLRGTAPRVTWVSSSVCPIYRVGVVAVLPALIAWPCHHSNCPLLTVEHLRLLLLEHGMVYQRTYNFVTMQRCQFCVKDSKLISFVNLILTLFLNLHLSSQ